MHDSYKDPLLDWNRLNKENAVNDFVSSMYISISETTYDVDRFSTWLLAGTGATSALLITQIDSIFPYLSEMGYKLCLICLVSSGLFGFCAKFKALRCAIQVKVMNSLVSRLTPIFEKHGEAEEQIKQHALNRNIQLQTDITMEQVIGEFLRVFPNWIKWLIRRQTSKVAGDRQAGYHIAVKAYMWQVRWTFFQSIFFILFIVSGGWYASSI